MSDIAPQALAETLADDARRGPPRAVEPLAGGRNNRVFRLDFADAPPAVLKWYHHDPRDPRDRLKTEWSFLTYVSGLGVRNVPQPLAVRPELQGALYSFVPGKRAETVTPALSRQAADFIVAINARPAVEAPLAPASEACFSIADHVATVDRRVGRLDRLDAEAPGLIAVRDFVRGTLDPAWQAAKADILRAAVQRKVSLHKPVGRTIVSPSDFGFHNALVDAQRQAVFVDFEYAGRDDPAKLICDYFCQPERPVPTEFYDEFVGCFADRLRLDDEDLWRARALSSAYRVKWVCIMLNEFSSLGARRRSFASAREHADRLAHQLGRAEDYLRLIPS